MKTIFYILFSISLSCTKAQTYGGSRTVTNTLFIFWGESGGQGRALNSDTVAGEGFARTKTKILSNTTYTFSDLQIGVNNLGGLATCHGWELALANAVDTGNRLTTSPVYLVKRAAGGTTIADWDTSMTISHNFIRSVDSGVSKMRVATGAEPHLVLWVEIGINDHIAGTSLASFKAGVKFYFEMLRARYGVFPIYIYKVPPAYATYNAPLVEISTEITKCYTTETATAAMQDPFHWSYAGNKQVVYNAITVMKSNGGF